MKFCPDCKAEIENDDLTCPSCMTALQPHQVDPIVPQGIEAEVCIDISQRQLHGIKKYGKTVADNPLNLRQWLQHAYEETLDKAVYLKRAMAELDKAEHLDASSQLLVHHDRLRSALVRLVGADGPELDQMALAAKISGAPVELIADSVEAFTALQTTRFLTK